MAQSVAKNSPSAPRGRPKDPAKRQAILDAAKHLFLTQGFAGTSMDAVAAEAGVSKLTVYSHFSDKETLFTTAVEAKCKSMMPPLVFELQSGKGLEETLRGIAHAFIGMVYSDDAMSLNRLLCTAEPADTEMAELFFEAGPQRNLREMEAFLRRAMELKLLAMDDPATASEHFFSLLMGCRYMQALIGCRGAPDEGEARERVEKAVQTFMRAFAARD